MTNHTTPELQSGVIPPDAVTYSPDSGGIPQFETASAFMDSVFSGELVPDPYAMGGVATAIERDPQCEVALALNAARTEPTARERRLFAPHVEESMQESNFDHLFAEADANPQTVVPQPIATPRWEPTDKTVRDARTVMAEAVRQDEGLETLFRESGLLLPQPEGGNPFKAAVTAVHENPAIRLRIAKYLRAKEEAIVNNPESRIPLRIARDNRNAPPRQAELYPNNITSKEYVVVLCLSQLDGTFDWDAADKAGLTSQQGGGVELGQHRAMASMVLRDYWLSSSGNFENEITAYRKRQAQVAGQA